MIYLIGLGLDLKDISLKALETIKKCKKIYLDNYTSKFPYSVKDLEKIIKKKVILANRNLIESDQLLKEKNIAILVYGDPLSATTHINFLRDTKTKVIHASSIITAVAESELSLYKFGKITSLPEWKENFRPTSFIDIIKKNFSIGAHTLLLVDIGMSSEKALDQLEQVAKNFIKEIIIISRAGTKDQKIFRGSISKLKNSKIKEPFCIIIPSRLSYGESKQ
ncbi:MAG: diphthine synthase [archaeon]|nr:MAG: diphthine synthase [archaeon]